MMVVTMKKGVFLVFALWIFILLSLFSLGLGFRTFIEVKKAKLFIDRHRAFYLAVSGIQRARQTILQDESNVDYLGEAWAQAQEKTTVVFSSPRRTGQLMVSLHDESARLNVNKVKEEALIALFDVRSIASAKEKVSAVFDYYDSDTDPRTSFNSEEGVKNEPLRVPEELMLVVGFSAADYQRVRQDVTVFGDEKVNINTVSRELLEIIVQDPRVVDEIWSVRVGGNSLAGDEDDSFYGDGGHPLPDALKSVFKTSSHYFRVSSTGQVGEVSKKITCVIERNSGTILYWDET